MMIPAGLSSQASFGDTKLFVQTEFAQRPKPRVTTTISLDGQVVEKVENIWEGSPQTEEERVEIEKFLKRQHQQVLEKIKNKKEKLVLSEGKKKETTPANISHAMPTSSMNHTVHTSVDASVSRVKEELLKTEGVFGWVFISDPQDQNSDEEQRMAHPVSKPEDKDAENLAGRIKDISLFLPEITGLGKFVGGILNLPESCMLFLPLRAHFLAIRLEPKVDFKKLVKRIKTVI